MERWLRRRRSQEKGRAEGGRRRHDRGSRAWVHTYVEYEKFEVAERESERDVFPLKIGASAPAHLICCSTTEHMRKVRLRNEEEGRSVKKVSEDTTWFSSMHQGGGGGKVAS